MQTPYSSIATYTASVRAAWVDEYNAERLASYDFYDDLFNGTATVFQMLLRTQDESPIIMPTAKRLCKAIARYVGRDWGYSITSASTAEPGEVVDPDAEVSEADLNANAILIAEAELAYGNLFRREGILSSFHSGKVEWIRRGDWLWYVSADPNKPEGKRISVRPIDPRTYFPLFDEEDVVRLSGARIIEEIPHPTEDEGTVYKVQQWLKPNHPDHSRYNPDVPEEDAVDIEYSSTLYEAESFGADESEWEVAATLVTQEPVVGISVLPIYHLRNNPESENPFGSSELRGLETLCLGINQAASDEDISLAMSGLGMYATDSGAPTDAEGNETDWIMGPGRVIEHKLGSKFSRVNGITSIQPFQDHIAYLEGQIYGTAGVSDVALGSADASYASQFSGVALAIRLQPLLDAAGEKDRMVNDIMGNLLHDLKQWFAVYEGIDMAGVDVVSVTTTDSAMPIDRATRWAEVLGGLGAGVFTLEFVLTVLRDEFGYDVGPEMVGDLQEQAKQAAAAIDPYGSRLADPLA